MDNVIIERILQRQTKANETILKELGKVIGEIGELTSSEAYTIAQQLKYGESLDKIVKTLSKYSRISEVEIYKMLEAEAKRNLALKKIYFKAKQIDFIPYKQNKALQNLVNEVAMATVNTYRNISATTGLTYLDSLGRKVTKPIKQAYMDIIDNAIMNISTGKQSFQQAMLDQLETIGNAGIQSIEYESGYHRRIDSAIRMNLQEGLSRLAEEQQELVGQQFDYNMVEVSHHENAAPDHIDTIDGKQFAVIDRIRQQIASGEEKEIKESDIVGNRVYFRGKWYEDFDYVNENLERQVGTLNCRHYTFTGVLGVRPRYSEEELKRDKERNKKGFAFEGKHYTLYEGEQLMRRLETQIRKNKDTQIIANAGDKQELVAESERKIDLYARKYYQVSKASGLNTRMENLKVIMYKQKQVNLKAYYEENLIGLTNDRFEIKEVSDHIIKQKWDRNLHLEDLKKDFQNPLKYDKIKYDKEGRPSVNIIGENITVSINPETQRLITWHRTHKKLAERLKGEKR